MHDDTTRDKGSKAATIAAVEFDETQQKSFQRENFKHYRP